MFPFIKLQPSQQESLLEDFYRSLNLVRLTYSQLDYCDPDFTDSAVFGIGAAECRLSGLLRQARKKDLKAW